MCLVILRGVNRLCGLLSVALLALGMVGFAALTALDLPLIHGVGTIR